MIDEKTEKHYAFAYFLLCSLLLLSVVQRIELRVKDRKTDLRLGDRKSLNGRVKGTG